MPSKALKFCNHPGCSELVTGGYCEKHQAEFEDKIKNEKKKRETYRASASERGYGSRWQKASKLFLLKHPLCAECLKRGMTTPAKEVDHIVPHKGDMKLFWDRRNWQGLCHQCHSRKTAKEDGRWG